MHVTMSDSAWREVHAVAAHDPLAPRVELDVDCESCVLALAPDLPHDGRAVHASPTVVSFVPLQVVDDTGPSLRVDTSGSLMEREDQWKYWPPSMTIV